MITHARDSINSYLRKGKMGKQVYLDLKTDFVEKAKFIHESTNTDVTKPIDILKLINYFTDIVLDEDTTSKKMIMLNLIINKCHAFMITFIIFKNQKLIPIRICSIMLPV